MNSIIPAERIEKTILLLRGCKVMLDSDLADLYGVTTKRVNEQVRRNRERFPPDFMFELTLGEMRLLKDYLPNFNREHGGLRYRANAFSEQGVAMLSSVLNSERAIKEQGSAMIELAAMMPLVAIFLIVTFQFAALFARAIHNVAMADAKASQAINEWDASHLGKGFTRPCIDKMGAQRFVHDGGDIAIGAGEWKKKIGTSQEVKIAAEPVCASK